MTTVKDAAEHMKLETVRLCVGSRDAAYEVTIKEVCLCQADRFNMPSRPQLEDSRDEEMYTHLDDISLEAVAPEEISILIGADVPEAVLTYDVRQGNVGQPLAIKTMFGWTLFGPSLYKGGSRSIHCAVQFSEPEGVSQAVSSLWDEQGCTYTVFVNLVTQFPSDVAMH